MVVLLYLVVSHDVCVNDIFLVWRHQVCSSQISFSSRGCQIVQLSCLFVGLRLGFVVTAALRRVESTVGRKKEKKTYYTTQVCGDEA